MELKKIIIPTIVACTVLTSAGLFLNTLDFKSMDSAAVLNEPIKNEVKEDEVKKEKISAYDFVNNTLEADGFKYLGGTKWGRGISNTFIIDLGKQEFQIADYDRMNVIPENWYESEFDKYISLVYHYEENKAIIMDFLDGGGSNVPESVYTLDASELSDVDGGYYELPIWMSFYTNQFKKYGCDITDLTEAKLSSYKTVFSKATESDVLSVFDLKSDDGVLRYYADVHVDGDIKDSSRYIEIQSMEELLALKSKTGFQVTYKINIINSDKTKAFSSDWSSLDALVVEEFVKDVVFPNTLSEADANEKKMNTIGVYFVDIDNPNGNFKSLYKTPVKKVIFDNTYAGFGDDLRTFNMPFETAVFGFEKDPTTNYAFIPYDVYFLTRVLDNYIDYIKVVNPTVKFSDGFTRSYSRPFAYDWQAQMGLTALFDAKYGMVNHSITYIN